MTEELVICEIRIDESAGWGDSDSRMTSFKFIMPLKLQSTMKKTYCKMVCIVSAGIEFVKKNDMFRQRKIGGLEFK